MDLGLNNKTACVTGSSRGIGFAVARRLATEGCRVAITGRTTADLNHARKALESEFGKDRVLAVRGDMTSEKDAKAAVEACRKRWGGLDILVANVGAGRIPGGAHPSDADWTLALRQNLFASTHAVRHAMGLLQQSNDGAIAVIGSIAGLEALGAPIAYAAAKAALQAWAKALSRETAAGRVRVNAVIPGNILFPGGSWERLLKSRRKKVERYIKREVPMRRFGTSEEIADAVAFIVSSRASFITGANLVVDGGQTRSFS